MNWHPSTVLRDYAQRVARRGRDVVSTMSLEIVGAISLMVIFPVTIRSLGPDMYGNYTILYLVFGLAGLWIYAGLTASIVQLVLQLEFDSALVMHLSRRQLLMFWCPLALGGSAVALALVGWALWVSVVLVIVVDLLLTGLSSLNLANIYAIDGVTTASRLRMLQPVVRTAGVAVLGVTGNVTVLSLVCVNVASSAIMLVASSIVIARRRETTWLGHGVPTAGEVLRYSFYYSTSMSTNSVQNEGEKFVLATLRPATEVGEYMAAYRVMSTTLIPMGALMGAAGRWFMEKDDRPGGQRDRTRRLSAVTAAYGVVVAIAVIFGGGIIEWVVGPEFTEVANIARWLCLFPLLHGLGDLPPMGLLGLGRNRERMFMGLATSGLSIIAYLALVPTYGWQGAVMGTYFSEIAGIVAGWILLVRYQRIADQRLAERVGVDA